MLQTAVSRLPISSMSKYSASTQESGEVPSMLKTPVKMAWEIPTARADIDMLDAEAAADTPAAFTATACFFFMTAGIVIYFEFRYYIL